MSGHNTHHEAIIIGGGQAGLAVSYYLRRAGVEFLLLDNQLAPGGAWRQYWPTLQLFSTPSFSSLPGMPMPSHPAAEYPPASHVVDYLSRYEQRYDFNIERPVNVNRVSWEAGIYTVHAGERTWTTPNLISATGIWSAPHTPSYPGSLTGTFWHAANYPGPETFRGTRVAVVGGANSGAQIAAELSEVAEVTWYTRGQPQWMPDEVDGRELFRRYSARALAAQRGETAPLEEANPGRIVMVPAVRQARDSGRLKATPMFESVDEVETDHLIWCTGFDPALGHLREVLEGRVPKHPGMHLLGYGDWNGVGSGTILGVGPFARAIAQAVKAQRSSE
ncbi:putative oxidoreductase CzcO [Corynebacterium occultum]|uniref:Putative oxidoreductase CzcO n=1 Tax=Corynebacterium occultum TaxID=2675219 RepID=A0A6B8VWW9_9CORY|nr:NAD(P)-binding domain-containing protein [Corynebacterium occultum]QGU08643.1 putative oxidoreductase CzcO [Corynebacterium occultum]